MDQLNVFREELRRCDEELTRTLTKRLRCIQNLTAYKKEAGIPILEPESEAIEGPANPLIEQDFAGEILDIYKEITKSSRRVQARCLFDYNIFLIGFMGAGKSTIADALREKLALNLIEMDQMIAEKEGMSIPEIFETYGEDYFRDRESSCLVELQKEKQSIVSCGGGIIVREENAAHMRKNGRIVLLTAEPETILERVKGNQDRPILNGNMNVEFIGQLLEKRRARYEAAADIRIATDHKTVDEICSELIEQLLAFDRTHAAN